MENLVRVVAMVVMYILITLYKRLHGKEHETFFHYVHGLLSFFIAFHSLSLDSELTAWMHNFLVHHDNVSSIREEII
jgi:hypothetical protein